MCKLFPLECQQSITKASHHRNKYVVDRYLFSSDIVFVILMNEYFIITNKKIGIKNKMHRCQSIQFISWGGYIKIIQMDSRRSC